MGWYKLQFDQRLGVVLIDSTDQPRLAEWLCSRIGLAPTTNLRCIGRLNQKGDIIGVVGYDQYSGTSMMMHCAGEGNWLSREFLRVLFDYPFRVVKLKVVFAMVCSTNTRALQLDYHVGFKYEHTLKDAFEDGDGILLSMRAEECRYLKENTHGR